MTKNNSKKSNSYQVVIEKAQELELFINLNPEISQSVKNKLKSALDKITQKLI